MSTFAAAENPIPLKIMALDAQKLSNVFQSRPDIVDGIKKAAGRTFHGTEGQGHAG